MKNNRWLETSSATALMLSKYFLSVSSVWGWWLAITGYVLIGWLNIRIKLKILTIVVAGLASLSAYGLYKWTNHIPGLQVVDFIVIALSAIFAAILVVKEAKERRPFWILQSIGTIMFICAYITLGMKMEIGWYAMLIGHINNGYLYYRKDAYIVGFMQMISIIIVLTKIIN